MADNVRIEIDDSELQAALSGLGAAAADMTPLMLELGAYVESSTQLRFRAGAGPDGDPWPPSIRAIAEGGRTLRDSGRLRDSFQRGPPSRHRVEVGTNVIYAAIHQFGGTIRPRSAPALHFPLPGGGWVRTDQVTIPARPFAGVDADDLGQMRRIVTDYLGDGLPQ